MGFEFKPKVYDLRFTDGDFAGLVVEVGALSIDGLLHLELALHSSPDDDTPAQVAKYREVLQLLAGALRSWNLTKGGKPVGTALADVEAQDSALVLRIVQEWYRALVVPPAPLPNGSSDSPALGLEESIPMTASSSPSQPN